LVYDQDKTQRHNREVVSAQPQRDQTQRDTEQGCGQTAERTRQPELNPNFFRFKSLGVGADRIERYITNV
jgi:hypothetical protein